jgi:hypothetical protein
MKKSVNVNSMPAVWDVAPSPSPLHTDLGQAQVSRTEGYLFSCVPLTSGTK